MTMLATLIFGYGSQYLNFIHLQITNPSQLALLTPGFLSFCLCITIILYKTSQDHSSDQLSFRPCCIIKRDKLNFPTIILCAFWRTPRFLLAADNPFKLPKVQQSQCLTLNLCETNSKLLFLSKVAEIFFIDDFVFAFISLLWNIHLLKDIEL